jgi:hypothetical protein
MTNSRVSVSRSLVPKFPSPLVPSFPRPLVPQSPTIS